MTFTPDTTATEAGSGPAARDLLVDTVAAHQISDVPSAPLSGGIDSSAVVALMAQRPRGSRRSRSDSMKTVSRTRVCAEGRGAIRHRASRDRSRAECHPERARPVGTYEPFGDTSAIPTYVVSKLAATQVKVVLTGDGGDELFAGYDEHTSSRAGSAVTTGQKCRRGSGS